MDRSTAQKRGRDLLARMEGEGWELIVDQNQGWHYYVKNCGLCVYEDEYRETRYYDTLLSRDADGHGGHPGWTEQKTYDDPNEAVRQQLQLANDHIQQLKQSVTAVETNVSKTQPASASSLLEPEHRCEECEGMKQQLRDNYLAARARGLLHAFINRAICPEDGRLWIVVADKNNQPKVLLVDE